jgi:hypothetical protein
MPEFPSSHTRTSVGGAPAGSGPTLTADAGEVWFYAHDKQRIGPFSWEGFRKLATTGKLNPQDMVWKQGTQRWLVASAVHGLFRPCPPAEDDVPPFPVVRVRDTNFGWKEAVVITPREILLVRGRFEPTEHFCDTGDPMDLGRVRVRSVPFSDVKQIIADRRGLLGESKHWVRYVVESAGHKLSFRVPYRDCRNVNGRLAEAVGARFVRNLERVTPLHEWLFLFAGSILFSGFVLLPAVFLFGNDRFGVLPLVLGGWAVLTTLWWGLMVRARLRDAYSAARPDRPSRSRRRRPASGRRPFRSRAVGWIVKLFAVAYAAGIWWMDTHLMPAVLQGWHYSPVRSLVPPMLYAPAVLLMYVGIRLSVRTFAAGTHSDESKVVLYLRSFADDARSSLQPRSLLAALHGIFPDWTNLREGWNWFHMMRPVRMIRLFFNIGAGFAEENYARAMGGIGRLVAIGRPNELIGVPGADRMYVRDPEWQAVVLDYLGRARAVILQPSGSDGVRWEIEQTMVLVPPHKVLLSMLNFYRRPDDYEGFREWLWLTTGVRLPAQVPHLDRPCFIDLEPDYTPETQLLCYRSPFLWPITGDTVAARRTFARFLAGLDGEQRPPPAVPRSQTIEGIGSLILFVFIPLALVIAAASGIWLFNY